MISQYPWQIDGITANSLVGSQPTLKLGEEAEYVFRFAEDPRLRDHITRAEEVKQYLPYSGAAAVWKTAVGEVRFREQNTSNPDLVVPIEAPSGSQGTQSIWGLVMGGSIEEDNNPEQQVVLSLSVVYLADFGAYATESDLRSALEK